MNWLTYLLMAILPATHCARFLEAARLWLHEILKALIDPDTGRLSTDFHPDDLALIDQQLASAEEMLRLALGVRVCELNGWSKRRCRHPGPGRGDPAATPERLYARLERCAFLLANFEAHAARRAHQLATGPLRLGASRQSTSPAFAVEATRWLSRDVASTSRRLGEVAAVRSAADGGGRSPTPARGRLPLTAS